VFRGEVWLTKKKVVYLFRSYRV